MSFDTKKIVFKKTPEYLALVQFNHDVALINTHLHMNQNEDEGATVIKLDKYPSKERFGIISIDENFLLVGDPSNRNISKNVFRE